jgi:hypothetical protein
MFFTAVAMTRQDAAIDYLLKQVLDGTTEISNAAAKALEPMRLLPRVGERLAVALSQRKG